MLEQLAVLSAPIQEIVFVDDASTDETRARILSWRGRPSARLLARDAGERGLAGAILAGARSTSAEILVVMDADLSHPPDKIDELLAPVRNGRADMVIGSRYVAGGTTPGWPRWRRVISRAASAVAFPLTGVHDSMCGFFAVRRDLLLRFAANASGFKIAFETIVRGRKELRVEEIPIVFHDRVRGESKMSWREIALFSAAWLSALGRRQEPEPPLISPAKVRPPS